ncbi:transglycosylase domain-containing protein [Streptomyces sp. NRRL S-87]|uniref:transglycosylase domain-containing protein n=1 Tax=Streptomyces sp. NRRL S-87 TaxID=1463920 RepID=UPI0004C0A38A|nr:transglycosylase domain-containing protein [Streptomyces sp. NRRL S-87]
MSEHRRKPPHPQGGGPSGGRRGVPQGPGGQPGQQYGQPQYGQQRPPYGQPQGGQQYGRQGAPGRPGGQYGQQPPGPPPRQQPPQGRTPYGQESRSEEQPVYGGRAEARRAAQRGSGSRRRGAEPAGGRGGRGGRGVPDKRFINYPRSDKDGWKRFVPSWKLVGGTALGCFAVLTAATGIALAFVDTPNPNDMATAQNNVYLWSDGTQMAAVGGERNRQILQYSDIPKAMKDAVIAAENESFDTDHGVAPMGIARAAWNMAKGGSVQGGSTITQQYVKNTFLDSDQTMTRKLNELLISVKLGWTGDKQDVMAGYLNTAYFGRGAYGVQAAAQSYFKKNADKLDPSECAFLAQILKGPNLYNPDGGIGAAATPKANTDRAKMRWAWVLDREVTVGRMSQSERDKYKTFPKIQPLSAARSLTGQTGYLVEIAKQYVLKKGAGQIDQRALDMGGYRIKTTFDKKKVEALTRAVDNTRKEFLDEKERPETDRFVQFGAASVDVKTGKIVAIYGGPGMDKNHFTNNANTSGVPVGSTWKPYVLAAAMEYGTKNSDGRGISPMSKYNGNDLLVIRNRDGDPVMGNNGRPFRQKNESPTAYGYVTLDVAMQKSINTPFVQLGFDVGHSKIREVAKSTGILEESMNPNDDASFMLGTSTPSAIRMADSYATFAASGTHREPYSVESVERMKDGVPLEGFEQPKAERVMDNSIADNVTKVLEHVVEKGTGTKVLKLGRPAAGKTGTTDKNKSAWFVGYTPQLSTSVTLFRTDPTSEDKELLSMNGTGGISSIHGGDIPAEIWTEYMKAALPKTVEQFPEPEDIGVEADGDGAPTASPSISTSPSASPSDEVSESPSPTPSKTRKPRPSCGPLDWDCPGTSDGGKSDGGKSDGGKSDGGVTDGGLDGGATADPSPSPSRSGKPGRSGGTSLFGGTG